MISLKLFRYYAVDAYLPLLIMIMIMIAIDNLIIGLHMTSGLLKKQTYTAYAA